MENPRSPLYTLKEASILLNVSPKTIYYWVSRNEIPYIKVGRHLRFQPAELIEFFKDETTACHPEQLSVNNRLSRSLKISRRHFASPNQGDCDGN